MLTAAGSIFSAGYDIGDLTSSEEAQDVVAHPFEAALAALDAFRFPVLAALNGHAIGGGLELAVPATCASWRRARSSACRRPGSG